MNGLKSPSNPLIRNTIGDNHQPLPAELSDDMLRLRELAEKLLRRLDGAFSSP